MSSHDVKVLPGAPVPGEDPRGGGNRRLTVNTALVLIVLFAIEIVTVAVGAKSVLTLHVMVGLVLVPPLLVKVAAVSWRFVRYYRRDEAYRRRGPPAPALRVLGPALLLATLVLFTSGSTLLLAPAAFGGHLKQVHAASFYFWLVLVLVHVAGHAGDLRRYATRDWRRRSRAAVPGALRRQLALLASLAAGLALALALVGQVGPYQHHAGQARHHLGQVNGTAQPDVIHTGDHKYS